MTRSSSRIELGKSVFHPPVPKPIWPNRLICASSQPDSSCRREGNSCRPRLRRCRRRSCSRAFYLDEIDGAFRHGRFHFGEMEGLAAEKRREEFIFYLRIPAAENRCPWPRNRRRLAQVVDNGADGGLRPGLEKSPYWLSRPPFQNNERAPWPIPGIACLKFADNPIAWAPQLLRVQTAANAIGSLEHHGMQAHAHQLIGAHHSGHPAPTTRTCLP